MWDYVVFGKEVKPTKIKHKQEAWQQQQQQQQKFKSKFQPEELILVRKHKIPILQIVSFVICECQFARSSFTLLHFFNMQYLWLAKKIVFVYLLAHIHKFGLDLVYGSVVMTQLNLTQLGAL